MQIAAASLAQIESHATWQQNGSIEQTAPQQFASEQVGVSWATKQLPSPPVPQMPSRASVMFH
jgi:hypothetical protein